MTFRYCLLAISLALSACATPNIGPDFALDKSAATGVATGSITHDGGYGAYRLYVQNSTTGERFPIAYGSSQTVNLALAFGGEKPDPGLGRKGAPFAVELPAGSYVLRGWQISEGAANVGSTTATGVEFVVRPHEAIYLGNFDFHETSHVVRMITGATVTLADQSARDLPVIRHEFPALASVPVTQSLATGAKVEQVGGASQGAITMPMFIPVAR